MLVFKIESHAKMEREHKEDQGNPTNGPQSHHSRKLDRRKASIVDKELAFNVEFRNGNITRSNFAI